jgi:DNA-binding PadR family transcriptional regulator
MATVPDVSELEGAVLGLAFARGALTPYAIRSAFERSRSSHWSGSAGAIYPLVARLVARGLLRAVRQAGSRGRGARACSLTPTGLRALRRWIGPPLPEWVAAVTFDPIRTRILFLDALPPRDRTRLLTEAEAALLAERRALVEAERQFASQGEHWEALATRGARAEVGARLTLVRAVRRALHGAPSRRRGRPPHSPHTR